jgi:predicted phosphodiesterase
MLALLYDIHGNLPALEAVLADARAAGANRFLLGGDYGLFGPLPGETVSALQGLEHATWIRGNVDRWCAHPGDAPEESLIQEAVAACREALGPAVAGELGALPDHTVLDGVCYCHGSPLSDVRSFMPEASAEDDELLHGARERRIVFGHTHVQFRRERPDGTELVNPGSVGLPQDGDVRAAYALVGPDGSLSMRRVEYDHEHVAAETERRFPGAAWAQRTAARLRSARA